MRQALSRGHDVTVLAIVGEGLESILNDVGCATVLLRDEQSVPGHLASAGAADVMVLDLTSLPRGVFEACRRQAPLLASLSPIFSEMADVDVVFTRSKAGLDLPGVRVYGGLEYAVFSESCRPIDNGRYRASASSAELPVAVSMGGADASNKTLAVLQAIVSSRSRSTVWVLLGDGYTHCYNALVDCVRGNSLHEVILAKTNRSMWSIMQNCALAILSGGLTTIEAVHAGLPSINLFEKPEHLAVVSGDLFEAGVCLNGGLFGDAGLARMVALLDELGEDRDRLLAMHRRCRGLIANNGSVKVLEALEQEHDRVRRGV